MALCFTPLSWCLAGSGSRTKACVETEAHFFQMKSVFFPSNETCKDLLSLRKFPGIARSSVGDLLQLLGS